MSNKKFYLQEGEDLPIAVRYAIEKCIEETLDKSKCKCALPDMVHEKVGHALGMIIEDVGVENMRENNSYVGNLRSRTGKIADVIIKSAVVAFAGGVLAALWYGIKYKLGK